VCTYDRWHGWWKLERDGHPARFPFGWGLTYSGFEWGEFSANVADGVLEVTGSVTNTGGHTAAEVVQVYGAAASFPDQPRRLVGFARLEVAPGAGAEVTIRVPLSLLAARDAAAARWVLPQGVWTSRWPATWAIPAPSASPSRCRTEEPGADQGLGPRGPPAMATTARPAPTPSPPDARWPYAAQPHSRRR